MRNYAAALDHSRRSSKTNAVQAAGIRSDCRRLTSLLDLVSGYGELVHDLFVGTVLFNCLCGDIAGQFLLLIVKDMTLKIDDAFFRIYVDLIPAVLQLLVGD